MGSGGGWVVRWGRLGGLTARVNSSSASREGNRLRDSTSLSPALVCSASSSPMAYRRSLTLDADQLRYDRGHRTLPLRVKGGKIRPKPVVPLAMQRYFDGRTTGPLLARTPATTPAHPAPSRLYFSWSAPL